MEYLEELEKIRQRAIKKRNRLYIVCGVLVIGFAIFMNDAIDPGNIVLYSIMIIVACLVNAKKVSEDEAIQYNKIYKKNITLAVFNDVLDNVEYIGQLPKEVIQNTQMVNMSNSYSSNDYIKAKYKNIDFESADVHIERITYDEDGNAQHHTIFQGQWFMVDFNKKIKSNIQIYEKGFTAYKRTGDKEYCKVETENVDFNDKFKVYAENELDAFYVLTPQVMEKMLELNDSVDGDLMFCFVGNKLHIVLNNHGDLFEPDVYKKMNIEDEKLKICAELRIITSFIDILDLDNDLFKRKREK